MAARPSVKTWNNMSPEELLAKHEELVARLQDPSYASIDPSSVKSGSPMHMTTRGTLDALESHMDTLDIKYQPSAGRILPIPGTAPAPAIIPPSASTANEPVIPASSKPVGKPVQNATTTASNAEKTSARVTHSGNATTRPAAVIKNKVTVAAKDIENVGAKTVSHEAGKTGAAFRKAGDDISRALLDGTKGTRNIKLLGAAALIGAGGFLMSKKTHQSNRDYDRQLEMQRRRNIM